MYEKRVIYLLQPQEQVAWAEGKRSTFLINKPSLPRQEFLHAVNCWASKEYWLSINNSSHILQER